MKKYNPYSTGIVVGILCGILDIIPMFFMSMTWDTIVSAFLLCVIGGFLIASSTLRVIPFLKGVIIFMLLAIPVIIVIGSQSPQEIIPMIITNIILGALMGFFIGKFSETKTDNS